MQKITAIEPQKRNQDRVNVYLDGAFAFGLALEVAAPLQVGQQLNEAMIATLQDDDTFDLARQRAFRFLSYRPRSEREIQRYLARKGYDDPLIEKVIIYLRKRDYLDDLAFAKYWVEQREAFKPRGPAALRQELFQKGIDRAHVDAALDGYDERAAALRAGQKRAHRWSNLPYDQFFQRLGNYLQRRGFNYEIIRATAEQLWHEQGD